MSAWDRKDRKRKDDVQLGIETHVLGLRFGSAHHSHKSRSSFGPECSNAVSSSLVDASAHRASSTGMPLLMSLLGFSVESAHNSDESPQESTSNV